MMAAHHRDVVLETIAGDEAEQRPEPRNLGQCDAAVQAEGVGGELAFPDIGFDRPEPVVGGGAEEVMGPGCTLPLTAPKQFSLPI